MFKKIVPFILRIPLFALSLSACSLEGLINPVNPGDNQGQGTDVDPVQPSEGGEGEKTPVDPALQGTYSFNICVMDGFEEPMKNLIRRFEKENTGIKINERFTYDSYSLPTAIVNGYEIPDLFMFNQDQTQQLIKLNALKYLNVKDAEYVRDNNSAISTNAIAYKGALYAYPLSEDNGYFLYYDKSIISVNDVGNMSTIIEKLKKHNRYISFELSSAWYMTSYFFGAGCVSEWTVDSQGRFFDVKDTFNSDKGLIAAKAMQDLIQSSVYRSSSATQDFTLPTPSAALVSGTWAYNDVKKILGNNFGVAELPFVTGDSLTYHLGSFVGGRYLGIKPQSDTKIRDVANLLAKFLSDYNAQKEYYSSMSIAPSNIKLQESSEVRANPSIRALNLQNIYATIQGPIHGSFWEIGSQLTYQIGNAPYHDDDALRKVLNNYGNAINALVHGSQGETHVHSQGRSEYEHIEGCRYYYVVYCGECGEIMNKTEVTKHDYLEDYEEVNECETKITYTCVRCHSSYQSSHIHHDHSGPLTKLSSLPTGYQKQFTNSDLYSQVCKRCNVTNYVEIDLNKLNQYKVDHPTCFDLTWMNEYSKSGSGSFQHLVALGHRIDENGQCIFCHKQSQTIELDRISTLLKGITGLNKVNILNDSYSFPGFGDVAYGDKAYPFARFTSANVEDLIDHLKDDGYRSSYSYYKEDYYNQDYVKIDENVVYHVNINEFTRDVIITVNSIENGFKIEGEEKTFADLSETLTNNSLVFADEYKSKIVHFGPLYMNKLIFLDYKTSFSTLLEAMDSSNFVKDNKNTSEENGIYCYSLSREEDVPLNITISTGIVDYPCILVHTHPLVYYTQNHMM